MCGIAQRTRQGPFKSRIVDYLQLLRARFEISSKLYRELSLSNLAVIWAGGRPSTTAFQNQNEAEESMFAAHDAYLEALAGPTGQDWAPGRPQREAPTNQDAPPSSQTLRRFSAD